MYFRVSYIVLCFTVVFTVLNRAIGDFLYNYSPIINDHNPNIQVT